MSDERALRGLLSGLFTMPAVLVAHDIGLFGLLAKGARTLEEVCRELRLEPRPAEALLAMCAAVELVGREDGRYGLLPMAEAFFVPGTPTSFDGYWDMLIRRHPLFSFESLKEAILTDEPSYHRLFPGGPDSEEEPDWPEVFTRAMHSRGVSAARVWPGQVDLSPHRVFLDVGGGSGVHAMEAARRWPHLQAVVFDRPSVCAAAATYITGEGLEGRVRTQAGDFWAGSPFPQADVHFYSEVFHNHSLDQCRALAQKSFQEMPDGGLILVHEMLLDDERTGPAPVAAASLNMLLWSEAGKQHTRRELVEALSDAGFADIRVGPACGYFSLISGRKPAGPGAAPSLVSGTGARRGMDPGIE